MFVAQSDGVVGGLLTSTQARVLLSILLVVGVLVLRWLVLREFGNRVDESELLFRTRKTTTYLASGIIVVGLGALWFESFDNLATFLGLASAGIAIALADVFLNMAGWAYVLLRHPFRIGDRIEIGESFGDVIDIRVFRFSLMEMRNWVDADQSTGRIVHIPNGQVFRLPMANYTEGFRHIWHEISVLITFESDWKRARDILAGILSEHSMTDAEMEAAREFHEASRHYFIRYADLDPHVYVSVKESGVQLTGRLVVRARERRAIDSTMWAMILDAFAAEPDVTLAYQTIRAVFPEGRTGDQPADDEG